MASSACRPRGGPCSSSSSCCLVQQPCGSALGAAVRAAPRPSSSRRQAVVARASAVDLASQAATLVGVAAAAWFASSQIAIEEQRLESTSTRPCPVCEGRGVEPCACLRWSDGDAGCATCNRTGMMACRACRGGGTAVPIRVTMRKHN